MTCRTGRSFLLLWCFLFLQALRDSDSHSDGSTDHGVVAHAGQSQCKQIERPRVTACSIPAIFLQHYHAFQKRQLNVSELSRVCDLSRTTVYKYISLLEA